MFGKFQRRNDRKARLSSWFERERHGDMQTLDVQGLATGVASYVSAIRREDALRCSARAAVPLRVAD